MSIAFEQFPLHPALLSGLARSGFTQPTALQGQAIEPIFDGRDVLAHAKPGAGQTLAFGLPILSLLDPEPHPQALIVVPNRDRCMRVWDVLSAIGSGTGLRVVALHAGQALSAQEQDLRRGADVVVGTPGRINDLLGPRRLDISKVRILVLDGADIIVEEGQRREIEALIDKMPAREQTLFFASAMSEGLAALVKRGLKDPVVVEMTPMAPLPAPAPEKPRTAARSAVPAAAKATPKSTAAAAAVDHFYMHVDCAQQVEALIDMMRTDTPERAVVVTCDRQEAKRLAQQLERGTELRTGCLLREMSANARSSMMGRFRSGDHRVLVLVESETSALEVAGLTHVYYLDVPDTEPTSTKGVRAAFKTIYLVEPDAETALQDMLQHVRCSELTAGVAASRRREPEPARPAASKAQQAQQDGPERDPRRRNRLGATRAPAHGHEPGTLLASVPEESFSTGPLAPLPRLRTSWQTFKVALDPGRKPNRDAVHTWLAQCTGVPRSSLRSIMVYDDHVSVEVEGREVDKFQTGLQDQVLEG